MKNWIFLLILLLSTSIFAQEKDSTLQFDEETKKVYQGDRKMSMDNLFQIMRPYPETFRFIESARDNKFYANVFYVLGSIPLGFTLGYFLPANKFLWQPFVAGAALVGIAIPFHVKYLRQTRRAVDSYNNRNVQSFRHPNEINCSFGFTQHGVGLQFRL